MKEVKKIYPACSECGCDLRKYDSAYKFVGDWYCEACVQKCLYWTDDIEGQWADKLEE